MPDRRESKPVACPWTARNIALRHVLCVLLLDMANATNLLVRAASKSVDLILVFAIMEALPRAGWLAGVLYILISDGLYGGQSLGKKLTGLKVETVLAEGGRLPCDIKGSILRNAAIGLGLFLAKVPFLGWIFFAVLVGFEAVTLIGSAEGRRFGDELAGTLVSEVNHQDKGSEDIV